MRALRHPKGRTRGQRLTVIRFIMEAREVTMVLVIPVAARCRPRSPRLVWVQNVRSRPEAWDDEFGDCEPGGLVC
jgi:hypothetical protein